MLLTRPEEFAHVAREWAQRYAGAHKPTPGSAKTGASSSGSSSSSGGGAGGGGSEDASRKKSEDKERRKAEERRRREAFHGYNSAMVERFAGMGFSVEQVVAAFEYIGIDKAEGEEYELEDEYIGDVTARLFGEM